MRNRDTCCFIFQSDRSYRNRKLAITLLCQPFILIRPGNIFHIFKFSLGYPFLELRNHAFHFQDDFYHFLVRKAIWTVKNSSMSYINKDIDSFRINGRDPYNLRRTFLLSFSACSLTITTMSMFISFSI